MEVLGQHFPHAFDLLARLGEGQRGEEQGGDQDADRAAEQDQAGVGDDELGGVAGAAQGEGEQCREDRKSTRLNSSHANISYAVFCLKKKKLGQYRTSEKLEYR